MANTCSECTYIDVHGNIDYGKFFCKYKNWVYAYDYECDNFCRAYSRSDSEIEQAIKDSENKVKRGCYITTTLCKILNLPDDNEYLMWLRKLRNEYLQKTEEGLKILIDYDVIGPEISKYIYQDNGKFNMAYVLLQNYIKPTVEFMKKNDYANATKKYTEMTEKLAKFYHIENKTCINIEDVDPKRTGHGILCLNKINLA